MGRGGTAEDSVGVLRGQSFDLDEIHYLVSKRMVSETRHPEADLSIFNYTPRAQYSGEWTDTLLACRGLILDRDGQVVARGFPKFFNLGDPLAAQGTRWTVAEKHDGSLGILYHLEDELRIATRGSFTSDQALAGTRLLGEYEIDPDPGTTPLFEIILPENRIVVDYGDRRELVLLAALDNRSGQDVDLPRFSGPVAHHLEPEELGIGSLEELLLQERENAEGWVARFEDGGRVKLKFSEYVRLHKLISGLSAKAIWDNLRNGDDLEAMIEGVPDEMYEWARATRTRLLAEHDALRSQARSEVEAAPQGVSRREVAEYFLHRCETPSGILFAIHDGRDADDLIWKQLEPHGEEVPPGSPR